MAKELIIKFVIDDSAAKKVAAAQVAGMEKLTQAAGKAGDRMEREAKRAADAQAREAEKLQSLQDRYAQRDYQARVKAESGKEAAAKRATDAMAREAGKLDALQDRYLQRDYQARVRAEAAKEIAAKRAADSIVRETERIEKAERQRYDRLQQMATKQLSQAEVNARAFARINQKAQDDRVNEAAKALAGGSKMDFLEKATAGAASFVAAFAGVSGIVTLVGSIADEFDRVAAKAEAAARKAVDYRQSLRAVAALEGNAGKTDLTMLNQQELRVATGATAPEAAKYTEELLGAGASGIIEEGGSNITRADMQELGKFGLGFGRAGNVEAGTMGKLAGGLPLLAKGKTTAAEQIQRLYQAKQLLDPGEGSFSSLSGQIMAQAGAMVGTGLFKDTGELFGLGSVLSHAGSERVGNRIEQLGRLTRGFGDVTKLEGTEMTQGDWLRSVGAKPADTVPQILEKLALDAEKAETAAKAAGQPFALDQFMDKRNINNSEEKQSFMAFYAYRDKWKDLKPSMDRLPALKEAQAYVADAQKDDAGQAALAGQQKAVAEELRGKRAEKGTILMDRAGAVADVGGAEESAWTAWDDWARGLAAGRMGQGATDFGRRVRQSEMVESHFFDLAKKNNIDYRDLGLSWSDKYTQDAMDPSRMSGIAEGFERRGINPYEGLGQVETVLKEIRDKLPDKAPPIPQAPPVLPGRVAPDLRRPGG